jgi:hypothetical protein
MPDDKGKGNVACRGLRLFIDTDSNPTAVEDWKDDHRGDDTVQIVIVAGTLLRLIWFSLRDAAQRRTIRDADDQKMSNMLAEGWEDALIAVVMVVQSPLKTKKYLLDSQHRGQMITSWLLA